MGAVLQAWNPWKIKIYLCLIMWANEKDVEWREIPIKRGQLLRSTRKIQQDISYIITYSADANRTKTPSLSTVQRVLDDLKVKGFIDVKPVQFGLLITINNYESLCNTPFIKMIQNIGNKMNQQTVSKKEYLKQNTVAPGWMLKEWGIK